MKSSNLRSLHSPSFHSHQSRKRYLSSLTVSCQVTFFEKFSLFLKTLSHAKYGKDQSPLPAKTTCSAINRVHWIRVSLLSFIYNGIRTPDWNVTVNVHEEKKMPNYPQVKRAYFPNGNDYWGEREQQEIYTSRMIPTDDDDRVTSQSKCDIRRKGNWKKMLFSWKENNVLTSVTKR